MAKRTTKKRITLLLLLLLAVAAVGGALYLRSQNTDAKKTDQQKLQEEEKKAKVDPKKDNEFSYGNRSTTPSSQAAPKTTVNPVITTLEQDGSIVILDATVGNVTSGTCTATFKKGGAEVTKSGPVVLVATYYACKEFRIPTSELSAGTWDVVVELASEKASGRSNISKVTVK